MKVKLKLKRWCVSCPEGEHELEDGNWVQWDDLAPLLRLWEAAATLLDSPGMDKYGPTKLRVDILRDAFAAVPTEEKTK